MGRPPNQAASRVPSIASARVPDSRRAISASLGNRFGAASAMMMPVMATTASTSMSVKASARPLRAGPRVIGDPQLLPVADIGRIAFAAARVAGAEAEHIDLALPARVEVRGVAP